MANEAIIIEKYGWPPGEPRSVQVASATALSAGTLMSLSGDFQTAVASSGAAGTVNQQFCGILAFDKDAADTSSYASVYTNVLADLVSVSAGNLPTVGQAVCLSGANLIRQFAQSDFGLSGGQFSSFAAMFVGISQEVASANERIAVKVRPFC